MDMVAVLQGMKVLELANVLAGPSVGQFLAEMGAEVLKIENSRTGGDVTRSWKLPTEQAADGVSAYFSSVNWGKKSCALDMQQAEDLERLHAWVREADIVLASYKPGDAEKLQVDYATFQALNPALIYASITGYGPSDGRAGYDAVIQAESGFMLMNGDPDGLPNKMPVALVDVLAGHQLKEAILLALIHRMRTGKGSLVEVSLFDAAVSALVNQATNWLNAGHIPKRMGSEHPNIVPYGTLFETADGKLVLLAVGTDKQFASLCHILGMELPPAFATNPQRVQGRAAIVPLLKEAILRQQSAAFMEALHKAHVPAAMLRNMAEVFEDPHAQALLLHGAGGKRGVRQFVGRLSFAPWIDLEEPMGWRE